MHTERERLAFELFSMCLARENVNSLLGNEMVIDDLITMSYRAVDRFLEVGTGAKAGISEQGE